MSTVQSELKALVDSWEEANRSRDVDAILGYYAEDLVAFDAILQLQFKGREVYKAHWKACLEMCPGALTFEVHQLQQWDEGDVGFGHFLCHCGGTDAEGNKDPWVRFMFHRIDMRVKQRLRREGTATYAVVFGVDQAGVSQYKTNEWRVAPRVDLRIPVNDRVTLGMGIDQEIQIFRPLIRHAPSFITARLRKRPRSEPASGSEMQIVAAHSPAASFGTHSAATASSAASARRWQAARVEPAAIISDTQPRSKSGAQAACTVSGRPCPPKRSGTSMESQPSPA